MIWRFQLGKYGSVAVGSAATDYSVFTVLLLAGADEITSQIFARLSGGVFAFVANKYWSFQAKEARAMPREARRFILIYVISYSLNISILYALTELVPINVYAAKITADTACFVFNFFVLKLYVFSARSGLTASVKSLIKLR